MNSVVKTVEVLLPVYAPLPGQREIYYGIIDEVIEELESSKFIFPLEADQLVTSMIEVKFKLIDECDERVKLLTGNVRTSFYLGVVTELVVIDKSINDIEKWSTPSIDLWVQDSVELYLKRLYDFIICLNIARVGSIEVGKGLAFVDNEVYKETETMASNLKSVYLFTQQTNWPTLEKLNIQSVWSWMTNKKGFLDGVGGTSIERALTALSYLFGSSDDSNGAIELFFTMIGLEALYCSSNNGIKEQLVEKAQVFLGPQNEYKKLFKGMYDYRSKFIHGGLNFPGKFHIFDGLDEFGKYMTESYDVTLMAQSVLIATLQQLSNKNMHELNFMYTLVR